MDLLQILVIVALVAGTAVGALLLACVGRTRLSETLRSPAERRRRFREVLPYLGALVAVLLVNKGLLQYSLQTSRYVGLKITGTIIEIEGEFVAWVQQLFPASAVLYFSAIYVFGYVVLLVFPILAYFFTDRLRYLKVLLTAYAINYGSGVICYTLFVAYGPRNSIPQDAAPLLYTEFPSVMTLTSMINYSSNVFPSLHTSLAVAAAIIAWRSREEYPRWFKISTFVATCVVLSTMILGIHWLIDVIAGLVLAVVSVWGAIRIVDWGENKRSGTNDAISGGAPTSTDD